MAKLSDVFYTRQQKEDQDTRPSAKATMAAFGFGALGVYGIKRMSAKELSKFIADGANPTKPRTPEILEEIMNPAKAYVITEARKENLALQTQKGVYTDIHSMKNLHIDVIGGQVDIKADNKLIAIMKEYILSQCQIEKDIPDVFIGTETTKELGLLDYTMRKSHDEYIHEIVKLDDDSILTLPDRIEPQADPKANAGMNDLWQEIIDRLDGMEIDDPQSPAHGKYLQSQLFGVMDEIAKDRPELLATISREVVDDKNISIADHIKSMSNDETVIDTIRKLDMDLGDVSAPASIALAEGSTVKGAKVSLPTNLPRDIYKQATEFVNNRARYYFRQIVGGKNDLDAAGMSISESYWKLINQAMQSGDDGNIKRSHIMAVNDAYRTAAQELRSAMWNIKNVANTKKEVLTMWAEFMSGVVVGPNEGTVTYDQLSGGSISTTFQLYGKRIKGAVNIAERANPPDGPAYLNPGWEQLLGDQVLSNGKTRRIANYKKADALLNKLDAFESILEDNKIAGVNVKNKDATSLRRLLYQVIVDIAHKNDQISPNDPDYAKSVTVDVTKGKWGEDILRITTTNSQDQVMGKVNIPMPMKDDGGGAYTIIDGQLSAFMGGRHSVAPMNLRIENVSPYVEALRIASSFLNGERKTAGRSADREIIKSMSKSIVANDGKPLAKDQSTIVLDTLTQLFGAEAASMNDYQVKRLQNGLQQMNMLYEIAELTSQDVPLTFTVFDLETTGLRKGMEPDPTQLSAMKLRLLEDGTIEVVDRLELVVKPEKFMDVEAFKTQGFRASYDDYKKFLNEYGVSKGEAIRSLNEFVQGSKFLSGTNIQLFDTPILEHLGIDDLGFADYPIIDITNIMAAIDPSTTGEAKSFRNLVGEMLSGIDDPDLKGDRLNRFVEKTALTVDSIINNKSMKINDRDKSFLEMVKVLSRKKGQEGVDALKAHFAAWDTAQDGYALAYLIKQMRKDRVDMKKSHSIIKVQKAIADMLDSPHIDGDDIKTMMYLVYGQIPEYADDSFGARYKNPAQPQDLDEMSRKMGALSRLSKTKVFANVEMEDVMHFNAMFRSAYQNARSAAASPNTVRSKLSFGDLSVMSTWGHAMRLTGYHQGWDSLASIIPVDTTTEHLLNKETYLAFREKAADIGGYSYPVQQKDTKKMARAFDKRSNRKPGLGGIMFTAWEAGAGSQTIYTRQEILSRMLVTKKNPTRIVMTGALKNHRSINDAVKEMGAAGTDFIRYKAEYLRGLNRLKNPGLSDQSIVAMASRGDIKGNIDANNWAAERIRKQIEDFGPIWDSDNKLSSQRGAKIYQYILKHGQYYGTRVDGGVIERLKLDINSPYAMISGIDIINDDIVIQTDSIEGPTALKLQGSIEKGTAKGETNGIVGRAMLKDGKVQIAMRTWIAQKKTEPSGFALGLLNRLLYLEAHRAQITNESPKERMNKVMGTFYKTIGKAENMRKLKTTRKEVYHHLRGINVSQKLSSSHEFSSQLLTSVLTTMKEHNEVVNDDIINEWRSVLGDTPETKKFERTLLDIYQTFWDYLDPQDRPKKRKFEQLEDLMGLPMIGTFAETGDGLLAGMVGWEDAPISKQQSELFGLFSEATQFTGISFTYHDYGAIDSNFLRQSYIDRLHQIREGGISKAERFGRLYDWSTSALGYAKESPSTFRMSIIPGSDGTGVPVQAKQMWETLSALVNTPSIHATSAEANNPTVKLKIQAIEAGSHLMVKTQNNQMSKITLEGDFAKYISSESIGSRASYEMSDTDYQAVIKRMQQHLADINGLPEYDPRMITKNISISLPGAGEFMITPEIFEGVSGDVVKDKPRSTVMLSDDLPRAARRFIASAIDLHNYVEYFNQKTNSMVKGLEDIDKLSVMNNEYYNELMAKRETFEREVQSMKSVAYAMNNKGKAIDQTFNIKLPGMQATLAVGSPNMSSPPMGVVYYDPKFVDKAGFGAGELGYITAQPRIGTSTALPTIWMPKEGVGEKIIADPITTLFLMRDADGDAVYMMSVSKMLEEYADKGVAKNRQQAFLSEWRQHIKSMMRFSEDMMRFDNAVGQYAENVGVIWNKGLEGSKTELDRILNMKSERAQKIQTKYFKDGKFSLTGLSQEHRARVHNAVVKWQVINDMITGDAGYIKKSRIKKNALAALAPEGFTGYVTSDGSQKGLASMASFLFQLADEMDNVGADSSLTEIEKHLDENYRRSIRAYAMASSLKSSPIYGISEAQITYNKHGEVLIPIFSAQAHGDPSDALMGIADLKPIDQAARIAENAEKYGNSVSWGALSNIGRVFDPKTGVFVGTTPDGTEVNATVAFGKNVVGRAHQLMDSFLRRFEGMVEEEGGGKQAYRKIAKRFGLPDGIAADAAGTPITHILESLKYITKQLSIEQMKHDSTDVEILRKISRNTDALRQMIGPSYLDDINIMKFIQTIASTMDGGKIRKSITEDEFFAALDPEVRKAMQTYVKNELKPRASSIRDMPFFEGGSKLAAMFADGNQRGVGKAIGIGAAMLYALSPNRGLNSAEMTGVGGEYYDGYSRGSFSEFGNPMFAPIADPYEKERPGQVIRIVPNRGGVIDYETYGPRLQELNLDHIIHEPDHIVRDNRTRLDRFTEMGALRPI